MKYIQINNIFVEERKQEVEQIFSSFLVWSEDTSRDYSCFGVLSLDDSSLWFDVMLPDNMTVEEDRRLEIENWFISNNNDNLFMNISVEIKVDDTFVNDN